MWQDVRRGNGLLLGSSHGNTHVLLLDGGVCGALLGGFEIVAGHVD